MRDEAIGRLLLCCHPLLATRWQLVMLATTGLELPLPDAARLLGLSEPAAATALRRAGRRLAAFGCHPAMPSAVEGRVRLRRLVSLLGQLHARAGLVRPANPLHATVLRRLAALLELVSAHPLAATPELVAFAGYVRSRPGRPAQGSAAFTLLESA